MILSGSAKIAGVMGWPVGHSRSPRLHGHWLERYGIDGVYLPLPVEPGKLQTALQALPALGFRGVNLTTPHKGAGMVICDEVTPQAHNIGAVNTVVIDDDGRLLGSNTDVYGFLENIRRNSAWQASDGPAVLLGAGGAARGLAVALADAGVPELRILNRTQLRADALATVIGEVARVWPWDRRADALDGAALLVNSTVLGMEGQPPLELDLSQLPTDAVVNDIVYAPLETPLLAAAAARGNPVVDGLGMLLYQAQPGFEAWFGVRPEVDETLRSFVMADLS